MMAVPQTHRVHCIQASGADEVRVADTSDELEKYFQLCRIRNSKVTSLTNSTTEQDSQIEDDAPPQLPCSTELNTWTVGYREV